MNLTREEMAILLGVNWDTVKTWEFKSRWHHQPQPKNLIELAKHARKIGWNPSQCTTLCRLD